ncbi:hypothetical protein, partial [Ruegeria faecimaris]|uniref:hypothetical protein n=1 Tax=Ruegeria faecimaris TaxID=686389 RepID=UPI00232CE168
MIGQGASQRWRSHQRSRRSTEKTAIFWLRPGPDGQSIVVDEGRIQTIEIEGVDTRTFQTLEKIFRPLTTAYPITLKQFERAVMLAEDIPDLELSTELDYPDQAGARLRVLGEPLRKQAGSATLDNPPRELG